MADREFLVSFGAESDEADRPAQCCPDPDGLNARRISGVCGDHGECGSVKKSGETISPDSASFRFSGASIYLFSSCSFLIPRTVAGIRSFGGRFDRTTTAVSVSGQKPR